MCRTGLIVLSLISMLAMSACTGAGRRAPPPLICPQLPPPPESLMQEPQTEQKVRAELLQPPQPVTPRSGGSRP